MKSVFPFITSTVLHTSSRYNQDIKVLRQRGTLNLYVQGIQQTGKYDTQVFDKAFDAFALVDYPTKNALVLGVGGGYVISKIKKLYPSCQVSAVDIDMYMIAIALVYFGLSAFPDIEFIAEDAFAYIRKASEHKDRFDFIVVDLYIGNDVPEFVESLEFLNCLEKVLSPHGHILINYQHIPSYESRRKMFERNLHKVFAVVTSEVVFPQRNIEYLLSSS